LPIRCAFVSWRCFARAGDEDWIRRDERVVRRVRRLAREELCEARLDLTKFGIEPAAV
jgi:hypothetical protein